MRQSIAFKANLPTALPLLLSVGLWTMLWLSISPGNPSTILNPVSPLDFAQGLRTAFPLIAAGGAAVIVGLKVFRGTPRSFSFFGPLALTAIYGLVGLIAALNSPDGSVALWWSALYLTVPIILWCVAWGPQPLDQLGRLVNQTWIIFILASIILLVVAALYLDLVDKILNPSVLLRCESSPWQDLTGGRLRSTGVGRYAALAGLITISWLWSGKWRPLWAVVFLTSVTLLLYTGARGSFGGFAAGASLMILTYLVYAGRRVFLAALLAMIVLLPLVWTTGVPQAFLDNCVFRGSPPFSVFAGVASLAGSLSTDEQTPAPTNVVPLDEADQSSANVPVKSPVGVGQPGDPKVANPEPPQTIVDTENPATTVQPEAPVGPDTENPATTVQPEAPVGPDTEPPRQLVNQEFFKLSGRKAVWVEGWGLFKSSPLIGFGFHADRLLLGTHMHNSIMHSLLQTGLIGTIPFVAAMIFGWFLFLRFVSRLNRSSGNYKHIVIQCGGVLAFLTMRSLPESTGAFFGVDWLILALVLFYLQVVNYNQRVPQ